MKTLNKTEVVVVTGASAGVGRATVRKFAQEQACIGLLARGRDGLEAARRETEAAGGRALVLPCDVADDREVERAAQEVERTFGPIDVWINNAMTSIYSPVIEMTPEEFRRVTEVTYLGTVYGTMAALRRMLPRDRGTIVQVGSALAYRSIPLQSAYCGAKYAVRGFTDSLRSELIREKSKVHVTMVQLPSLNTPQFEWVKNRLSQKPKPPSPIFQPEVAADAIYWAAHNRRRELYVGSSSVKAIEGNKVAPGFLDAYLSDKAFDPTDEPSRPDRPHNLWNPLPGDYGAHGPFDEDATSRSLQLMLAKNRGWALSGALLLAGGIAGSLWKAWRD